MQLALSSSVQPWSSTIVLDTGYLSVLMSPANSIAFNLSFLLIVDRQSFTYDIDNDNLDTPATHSVDENG